jgi:hypothetical protein
MGSAHSFCDPPVLYVSDLWGSMVNLVLKGPTIIKHRNEINPIPNEIQLIWTAMI